MRINNTVIKFAAVILGVILIITNLVNIFLGVWGMELEATILTCQTEGDEYFRYLGKSRLYKIEYEFSPRENLEIISSSKKYTKMGPPYQVDEVVSVKYMKGFPYINALADKAGLEFRTIIPIIIGIILFIL